MAGVQVDQREARKAAGRGELVHDEGAAVW
jgi:hypothetical protein